MQRGIVQVGRYRLIAELAHGGMGDVYLGVAQGPAGFSKLMVIKMLRPALADDEQFLTMFLEEARLAARLNHPNVVQTVEVGSEGRTHFLAMEYLEGQSLQRLRQRISKEHAFPLGLHLRILVETLHGLHYAHELVDIDGRPLGIVHRDATPHNVFVTYDGQVKVVDFGIAKAMDSSLETRTGELKGKVAYMPPEQAASETVDRRADVFAIGVLIWEAAVGHRLWKGKNEIAIMADLHTGKIPSLRDADPNVAPELEAICNRALAPRPEDRYATAADLAADLEEYLAKMSEHTTPRDIARLVSDAFDSDRRELRQIIDGQLRTLRDGGGTTLMPKLSYPPTSEAPPSVARPRAAALDQGAAPSFTTGGTASAARPSSRPEARRNSLIPAAVMIAAAVGLLGLVMFVVLQRQPAATDAPRPMSSAQSGVSSIDITVTTNTPAQLFLDDAPLGPSPYRNVFPRDGLAHRVRAEAPAHAPRTEIVVFDKASAAVDIALTKGAVAGETDVSPIASSSAHVPLGHPPPPTHSPAPPFAPSRVSADPAARFAAGVSSVSPPPKPVRAIDTSLGQ